MMADGSEGFRLRTIKLRGQISQGLILPVGTLDAPVGTDVTDILGIKKYEAPIPACISGEVLGRITGRVRETDQERIQNLPEYFEKYKEELFEVSEKLDGTSMSCYDEDGQVFIAGHHWAYKESDKQTMWRIARRLEIPDRLKGLNIALQGECIGESIQSNKYKITGQDWYVFDVWDLNNSRYMTPTERRETLKELNIGVPDKLIIKHVPIIEGSVQVFKKYPSMQAILTCASGGSILKESTKREGLVFKSCNVLNSGIVSFKVIDNTELLVGEKE